MSDVGNLSYTGTASNSVEAEKLANIFQDIQKRGVGTVSLKVLNENSTNNLMNFVNKIHENQGLAVSINHKSVLISDKLIDTIRRG